MNSDILEGKWLQIKGKIRDRWGDLTDDDVDRIEGKRERLVGILQEKYGHAREVAEEEVRDFESRFDTAAR